MEEPAGVERVRDEPELEAALPQRLEQARACRARARAPDPRPRARPRGSGRAAPRRRRPRSPRAASRTSPGYSISSSVPSKSSRRSRRTVLPGRRRRRPRPGARPRSPRGPRAGLPRPAPCPRRTASACRPSRRERPPARVARVAAWAGSSSGRRWSWPRSRFCLRYVFDAGDTTLFVVAAAALVPLAWLIGEATEHAGEHTGPGIGGFLNASFGNAPELIIALFAVSRGPAERRARLARGERRLEPAARARPRARSRPRPRPADRPASR